MQNNKHKRLAISQGRKELNRTHCIKANTQNVTRNGKGQRGRVRSVNVKNQNKTHVIFSEYVCHFLSL